MLQVRVSWLSGLRADALTMYLCSPAIALAVMRRHPLCPAVWCPDISSLVHVSSCSCPCWHILRLLTMPSVIDCPTNEIPIASTSQSASQPLHLWAETRFGTFCLQHSDVLLFEHKRHRPSLADLHRPIARRPHFPCHFLHRLCRTNFFITAHTAIAIILALLSLPILRLFSLGCRKPSKNIYRVYSPLLRCVFGAPLSRVGSCFVTMRRSGGREEWNTSHAYGDMSPLSFVKIIQEMIDIALPYRPHERSTDSSRRCCSLISGIQSWVWHLETRMEMTFLGRVACSGTLGMQDKGGVG